MEAAFNEGGNEDVTARVLPRSQPSLRAAHRRLSGQLYETPGTADDANRRSGDDRQLARAAAPLMPNTHDLALNISPSGLGTRYIFHYTALF
jgi:hypothetical protein